MPTTLFPKADKTRPVPLRGEMLERIHAFDWSAAPIGPIIGWDPTIRSTVRLMLSMALPVCLLVGRDGIMIYNDAYIEVAGARHPSSLGSSVFASWPEVADFNRDVIDSVLSGKSLAFENQHFIFHRNGTPEEVWLDLDYSPVLGDDGLPIATMAVLSEMTKRVKAERALALSEERLSLAFSASGIAGAWDWDIDKDIVVADRKFGALFGLSGEEAERGAPVETFLRRVHPDDIPSVWQGISSAVEERGDLRVEFRLQSGEETRWIMSTGKVVADPLTGALRLPGIIIDISERKAFEEALAASETGFRTLAETMPQMVWSTPPDGRPDYCNARWFAFIGVAPDADGSMDWLAALHPDDCERTLAAWARCLATGDEFEIEYRFRHHSGQYRWTLGRALPIRNDLGQIIRWIGTCTDIHETKVFAEEREMVAQELSHRIKNIFSVLNSIIGLSARSRPEIKPFTDELRQRIAAMGKAHDFVRPHSSASRPMASQRSLFALVGELLEPHRGDDDSRIVMRGDDPVIDDGAATPLALIFHELATNAAKYGALAASDGRVALTSTLADGTYRLTWKETGGRGLAETAPRAEGFGSRLISLSTQGQLGGQIERHWEQDGLRVELMLPAAQLSKSSRLRQKAS